MSRLKGFVWMSLEPVVLKRTERFKAKSFSTVVFEQNTFIDIDTQADRDIGCPLRNFIWTFTNCSVNPDKSIPKTFKFFECWGFRYEAILVKKAQNVQMI